ncbi:MAG: hypothetical protein WCI92_13630 [Bacteroidota bacterium]
MKIATILFILVFPFLAVKAQKFNLPDRKIKILIVSPEVTKVPNANEINGYVGTFEKIVAQALSDNIPCASVITRREIIEWMEYDRMKEMMGAGGRFDDIAGALGCDILINLTMAEVGGLYYITGSAMSSRNASILERGSRKADIGHLLDEMDKYSNDLVRELLAMEICPYKGDLTFTSAYTYDLAEKDTGLPEKDCDFERDITVKRVKQETWTLKKVSRIQADGNVNAFFDFKDENRMHSNCYHCQVMEGTYLLDIKEKERANITESTTITETYDAKGLAVLDPTAAFEKYHAIIKINFDIPANTYTISVKAISEPGKYNHKTEYRKKGCPYFEDSDNEWGGIYPVSIDRVHGPFPGNPFDKTLKQSITKEYPEKTDKGKGNTVETLEFNLTR